jgi:hypothetical protein
MEVKMKRGQALKYINDRLMEGASKAEVLEEIRGDVPFRTDLLSYLAEVPILRLREKYRKINIILLGERGRSCRACLTD